MSRRTRVLTSFGVAVVLFGSCLWFFGTQIIFVLEARHTARKLPFVEQTPAPLTDLSISRVPGMKLSYFGYEFEIPWTDIDQEKSKIVGGNKAIIAFRSGNVLSIWSGPPHEFMNGLLATGKLDQPTFRRIYGDQALESDYNFMRLILEATPDKVRLFSPRSTTVSQGVLLSVKALCTPGDPSSGIFEVKTGPFKGFQYGRLQSPPKVVNVELFPEDGHLDLFFGQKRNGLVVISQGDINRVVQTIHKAVVVAGGPS
jgi:hypothetical protein